GLLRSVARDVSQVRSRVADHFDNVITGKLDFWCFWLSRAALHSQPLRSNRAASVKQSNKEELDGIPQALEQATFRHLCQRQSRLLYQGFAIENNAYTAKLISHLDGRFYDRIKVYTGFQLAS